MEWSCGPPIKIQTRLFNFAHPLQIKPGHTSAPLSNKPTSPERTKEPKRIEREVMGRGQGKCGGGVGEGADCNSQRNVLLPDINFFFPADLASAYILRLQGKGVLVLGRRG